MDPALELRLATPPAMLYHGTSEKHVAAIEKSGLHPRGRLHVHLSPDPVAAAHAGPSARTVVFVVDTRALVARGQHFYLSREGLWLTDSVPVEAIAIRSIT